MIANSRQCKVDTYNAEMQKAASMASALVLFFSISCANFWSLHSCANFWPVHAQN